MELSLYIKEGEQLKSLKVPVYVVRDLLRDRLSKSEVDGIHRFAEKTRTPKTFKPGSVLVDFGARTAQCFQAGLKIVDLEPTWNVQVEEVTLEDY